MKLRDDMEYNLTMAYIDDTGYKMETGKDSSEDKEEVEEEEEEIEDEEEDNKEYDYFVLKYFDYPQTKYFTIIIFN